MTKKILIIDDNPNNRQLAGDILTYHGYEVMMACDGEIGVAMAKELQPDLVLMDIQMPVLDGFAAVAMLKKNPSTRKVKIIAMTALAMKGDREKIIGAGFDGYLAKPFNTRELPQVVAQHVAMEKNS